MSDPKSDTQTKFKTETILILKTFGTDGNVREHIKFMPDGTQIDLMAQPEPQAQAPGPGNQEAQA